MKFLADRAEQRAIIALIFIVIGVPVIILGYQFGIRPRLNTIRTIDIVAAAPENGGFQPAAFEVNAGETIRLRVSSPDVVHGLAIGPGEGWDFGIVKPGEVKEIEITFPEAGRYTLYCNVWCSPSHWRMRAAIDVFGDALATTPDPIIERLTAQEINIDAPHPAENVPAEKPSVTRGKTLLAEVQSSLPPDVLSAEWRQSHSPAEARALLINLDDAEAWDVVAALWLGDADPVQLDESQVLYAKNCAACHGATGNGDGIGAATLIEQGYMGDGPAAFADPTTMLGASSDILYGKLRRGGMGTGMPGFGTVFTREQSAQMIDYLWTFVFSTE